MFGKKLPLERGHETTWEKVVFGIEVHMHESKELSPSARRPPCSRVSKSGPSVGTEGKATSPCCNTHSRCGKPRYLLLTAGRLARGCDVADGLHGGDDVADQNGDESRRVEAQGKGVRPQKGEERSL